MSDDVIGNVKEAFEGKRGKVLLIGGGIAIAAYVLYTRYTGTPEVVADDGLVPSGGSGGRVPQSDPPVGNDNNGSAVRRPTSNAAWLTDGVDYLVGRGTPAGTAHTALTKALGGEQISSADAALVSQVISALGSPPEGMPPLNTAPPTGNPQGGTVAAPRLHQLVPGKGRMGLMWSTVPGATSYIVYWSGGNSARGIKGTHHTVSGLKSGRSYTFSVAAYGSTGGRSPLSNQLNAKVL